MKNCVRRALLFTFSRIGYNIGRYPVIYVVIPILLALILSSGILNVSLTKDLEHLYIPRNARSRTMRNAMESLFPINNTRVSSGRFSRINNFQIVTLVHQNDSFMLDEFILDDLIKFDNIVNNISIVWNNDFVYYKDLCKKTSEENCFDNIPVIQAFKNKLKSDTCIIKYPVDKSYQDPLSPSSIIGGEVLNDEGCVRNFKAIRFLYILDDSTLDRKEAAKIWEKQFLEVLKIINFKNIKFYVFNLRNLEEDLSNIVQSGTNLILIITPILLLFTSLSSMSPDIIKSKPWLGIASCTTPFLSTTAAFGLLIYCKMEFIDMNIFIIFLLIGIGLDDSFVMIAAWRKTDSGHSIPKRMSKAYEESAMSITLTSLTNFLAFCMAYSTPYGYIKIISVYSALSIVFDYIYQLTFFGGLLALEGYREKFNIHSVMCWPVKSLDDKTEQKVGKSEKNVIMNFITYTLGPALGKKSTKIIVTIVFAAYIIGGVYCVQFLKVGGDVLKVFQPRSHLFKTLEFSNKYFSTYPYQINVIINQTLDYSNRTVQKEIETVLKDFESAPHMAGSNFTESWLKEYLSFINSPVSKFSLAGLNMSNSDDFLYGLKNVYLNIKPARRFKHDVLFSSDGTQIVASRFLLAAHNIKNDIDKNVILQSMFKVTDSAKYPVYVYNFWFMVYEGYFNVTRICLQTLCYTIIIMMLVFMAFIPNVKLVVASVLTIASIQLGIIGYMSVIGVNLDGTSMLLLIISTGFSVDYMAHISYAYISCTEKDPNKKIINAFQLTGYPILQGALSTLICVVVLYFGPSYQYVVTFKLLSLMIVFALFHSLLLVPVVLSCLDLLAIKLRKESKENDVCIRMF
ncbi:patched domain-containing protein 3-like [Centruroides vittatus]|uniref:patched domain-containing protein 3-like n=1 Tax=Centruroides vittatus TaxID=120091 RepID=UPI00350ECBC3